jgi:hypothetical protein
MSKKGASVELKGGFGKQSEISLDGVNTTSYSPSRQAIQACRRGGILFPIAHQPAAASSRMTSFAGLSSRTALNAA